MYPRDLYTICIRRHKTGIILFIKSLKARKGNNMFDLTVLSWLFPTEEGAKIPHSSVICFGDEVSYCKSGMIRKKFSGKFSEDTITSLIEFDNVLSKDI